MPSPASCRMRSASLACTRCSTTSGRPGRRTVTSGSWEQAPSSPRWPAPRPRPCGRSARRKRDTRLRRRCRGRRCPCRRRCGARDGTSFAKPGFANRVECADIQNSRHQSSPAQRPHLALQRPFVHVAADAVIDFHHRRQRALPEARHRANRELAVRRGQRTCRLRCVSASSCPSPRSSRSAFQQAARAPRVARRPAADADCVVPLRLQVEQRIERRHAIDLR